MCRILVSNLSGMRGRASKLFTLPRSSSSLALSSLIMSSGSVFTLAMILATSSGTYPSLQVCFEKMSSVSWSSDTFFQYADQCEPTRGRGRVLWHPQCVFPKHIRRQISNEELQESKRRPAGMSWSGTYIWWKLELLLFLNISQEVADALEVERIGPQHQVGASHHRCFRTF